jgi:hypothetical protein
LLFFPWPSQKPTTAGADVIDDLVIPLTRGAAELADISPSKGI